MDRQRNRQAASRVKTRAETKASRYDYGVLLTLACSLRERRTAELPQRCAQGIDVTATDAGLEGVAFHDLRHALRLPTRV